MRILLISASLAFVGLLGARLGTAGLATGTPEEGATATQQKTAAEPEAAPANAGSVPAEKIAVAQTDAETAPVSETAQAPSGPRESAVASLRQGMESGDPRTPPLAPEPRNRDEPSDEELADPDLYQAYEARQRQQVYASFAAAASKKITNLEEMIAAGRGSATAAQLAEAERKVERLREQRALLLEQHPDLKQDQ